MARPTKTDTERRTTLLKARRRDREFVRASDPIIRDAWQSSDNGASFVAALAAHDYILARGDRRDFVIVDPRGKSLNPARQVDGLRVRDVRARLADLDPAYLPSVAQARARLAEKERQSPPRRRQEEPQVRAQEKTEADPDIWDRDAAAILEEKRLADAAIRAAQLKGQAERISPQEREKRRFEGWANHKRAELQSRQLAEGGELGRKHHRQREELEDRLNETYGADLERMRRKLEAVQARQHARLLTRLVDRVSGRAGRNHMATLLARMTIENTEQRIDEQRGQLTAIQGAQRESLDAAHRRQSRALEDAIEQARARREQEGWRPRPGREPANDQDREGLWERIERRRAGARDKGDEREREL